ncbi:hypothetical protein MNBD_GAMMA07-279 [hydrothermal vent metagenome]|uniref:Nudix hydrolase domain-containing protein n=1 Tax=hydrothermal vent metagenome TaxID=652676 RepID=A0A3B0WP42_9ZZZZ
MSNTNFVASAVATLVIKHKKLLLGKRFENNRFIGWQCPGGYLNKGENIETAAKHICLNKAGINISDCHPGPYTNNIFSNDMHTTTLYIIAEDYVVQNSDVFENKKIEWSMFSLYNLPEPLFLPLRILQQQYNLAKILDG